MSELFQGPSLEPSPTTAGRVDDRASLVRPSLLESGRDRLTLIERLQIRFIRQSFEPGALDRTLRFCQRHLGSTWIHHCTKHLRTAYGLERLPRLDPAQSFILVSNHRSFFDLYVITAELVRRGLPHRIIFPVRANFFYDTPLGFLVNGAMSFFAMYPPIFRERQRALLNVTSLDELVWLLRRGGAFAGMHPEGTRKQDDDAYALLPAQPGVGRVIYDARVPVLPVFINGLINRIGTQVKSNFDGTGIPVMMVFGAPVDFGDLLSRRASPRVYRAVSERTLEAIGELASEEKRLREGSRGPGV